MPANTEEQAAAPAHDKSMAPANALSGSKRKELEQQPKKKSFKAVANLVLAMRRFSNSINPTYTFGKRTSSGGGSKTVTEDKETVSSGRPTSPGQTEGQQYAYTDHGHRFDFLLKPLPPTEDEEVSVAPGAISKQ